jgi:protein kinase A
MLKRMASKFSAHLGSIRKPVPKDAIPIPELSSASSSTLSHIPTMPGCDYRGSISTDRTSASQNDTEETIETIETKRVRLPQRPKGTYRLSDFIIQRTLGTGSFGRVHLGMYYFSSIQSFC